MKDTLCMILGGGQGSRLFPLTMDRSKPAVPLGGKYRLIDFAISNCLNSEINRIYILTQFNSASLNKHINHTYRFDAFNFGFVDILAAEQSMENVSWYQGTADAVRKNLKHILAYSDVKHVLILSGDQVYTMDFNKLYERHMDLKADVTVSVVPVTREDAPSFGILKINEKTGLITDFVEKPNAPEVLDDLAFPKFIQKNVKGADPSKNHLASMGIYLFNVDALQDLLDNHYSDFGKEVIPHAIEEKRVGGYLFNRYWEDVGTIKAFWQANIKFASDDSDFNFVDTPIYTNSRHLPASRLYQTVLDRTLVCEGATIHDTKITSSVIGIRAIIEKGCEISDSVIMGADFFETEEEKHNNKLKGMPNIGIGSNCIIRNAIIDKNARIGDNCTIQNERNIQQLYGRNYYIRDGLVIVPKGAVIPNNTII